MKRREFIATLATAPLAAAGIKPKSDYGSAVEFLNNAYAHYLQGSGGKWVPAHWLLGSELYDAYLGELKQLSRYSAYMPVDAAPIGPRFKQTKLIRSDRRGWWIGTNSGV